MEPIAFPAASFISKSVGVPVGGGRIRKQPSLDCGSAGVGPGGATTTKRRTLYGRRGASGAGNTSETLSQKKSMKKGTLQPMNKIKALKKIH